MHQAMALNAHSRIASQQIFVPTAAFLGDKCLVNITTFVEWKTNLVHIDYFSYLPGEAPAFKEQ